MAKKKSKSENSFTQPFYRWNDDNIHIFTLVGLFHEFQVRLMDKPAEELKRLNGNIEAESFKEKYKDEFALSDAIDENEQLILQMALCRTVDNFLNYISELLALIFSSKPEALRSSTPEEKKVDIDILFNHSTIEEAIAYYADRRVYELSRKSIVELSDYMKKQMKFDLFKSKTNLEVVAQINEIRNLITHNRGTVGMTSKNHKDFTWDVGAQIELDDERVIKYINAIEASVLDIEKRAVDSFNLPTEVQSLSKGAKKLEVVIGRG